MRRRVILAAVALLAFGAACGKAIDDKHVIVEPATVEAIDGTGIAKVTLTERAVQRLGIETAPVATAGNMLTIPSGSIWLDIEGRFWVYTNPEPLVYVRAPVTLEEDDGEVILLSDGPAPGTSIVTIGVAELYGTEVGVGK